MKLKESAYFLGQIIRMHLQPNFRVPLSVYVVLTNRCTNACVYCRVHDLPQQDVLTTRALKTILFDMKGCGVKRLHLTGGEPMLRDDIGEIISYAKDLGFFVGMSSNGFEIASRIKELNDIDIVFLSYDGPPRVHARLRGERSIEDVNSALHALKSAGIKAWTSSTLTRLNAPFLDEIVDFARQNNILANFNRLEFFPEPPNFLHPLFEEVKDLALCGEERKNVFRKLIQLKLNKAPIGSSLAYLQNGLEWPYDDRITDLKPARNYQCWAGRAFAHLEADGNLYACSWGSLRQVAGRNVLQEGFRSAWKNLVFMKDCRSCSHACGVEHNLLFSLNFSSIFNAFIQLHR